MRGNGRLSHWQWKTLYRELITEWKYIEWLLQEVDYIKFTFTAVSIMVFLVSCFFFPWTVKQLVAHSVSLVRIGWLEDWVGLLLTCQHPSTPQLSAVPCSSWPGCLSAALTGEGGRRWIRGMTKISPALTPLWVARRCHAASECATTVTFSHFKAHKQMLYPHIWCTSLILRARFYISLRVLWNGGVFCFIWAHLISIIYLFISVS